MCCPHPTSSNDASQRQLQAVSKRLLSAQAAAQQLNKQLVSTQDETGLVLKLTAAVEAPTQQATHLSELLLSQDDAEHLALSAVARQVAELQQQQRQQQLLPQQTQQQGGGTGSSSSAPGDAAAGACHSLSEEDAAAVLQQLACLLKQAGACDGSSKGTCRGREGAEAALGALAPHAADGHQKLVHDLLQLRSSSRLLFQRCSIANWLQQQQQQLPQG